MSINFYPLLAAASDICAVDPKQPTRICNPTNVGSLPEFITNVLIGLGAVIGILTILMVVVSGFRMIVSQGDAEAISKAKSSFQWSLSGFLLTLFSFIIVYAIGGFLQTQPVNPTPGQIGNPLKSPDIFNLVRTVLNNFLILVGLLALLFIIVGGFRYMTANGNEEQTEKARQSILWAVIGLVVSFLAFVIVSATSQFFIKN